MPDITAMRSPIGEPSTTPYTALADCLSDAASISRDSPVWRICKVLESAGCEPWLSVFRGCWLAYCPLDVDHDLWLSRGDDGRAELECLSGCSPELLCRVLGLSVFDLCQRFTRPAAA
jgi:hypothetical protein